MKSRLYTLVREKGATAYYFRSGRPSIKHRNGPAGCSVFSRVGWMSSTGERSGAGRGYSKDGVDEERVLKGEGMILMWVLQGMVEGLCCLGGACVTSEDTGRGKIGAIIETK